MKQKYTARLEAWSYDPYLQCFWGWIFDDVHKRWPDDTYIHTSGCSHQDAKKGAIIQTMNSTYLLGEPSGFIKK